MIDLTMNAFKLKATLRLCSPALNRRVLAEMLTNGIHPEVAVKLVDLPKHECHAVLREWQSGQNPGDATGDAKA